MLARLSQKVVHVSYGVALECNGADTSYQKILEIKQVTTQKLHSTLNLFECISLVVPKGEHLLMIGPCGNGETSLLKTIVDIWFLGEGDIRLHTRHSN